MPADTPHPTPNTPHHQDTAADAWRVSLHGGHSGEFCDHADGTLREMLTAAVRYGYHTFGVSEHVPRCESRFLYPEEVALGWTVEKITADFERYQEALTPLVHEFEDRLVVLRGFECEVVPSDRYVELMNGYRHRRLADGSPAFDYCVGSVHHVAEMSIDGPPAVFQGLVEEFGGLEPLAIRYYETVAAMVSSLRPEMVAHIDLIKKNCGPIGLSTSALESPSVQRAALGALEAVRAAGSILDLNTAAWRKGLNEPYPAPWLVRAANSMGIGFCFGDDSHRPGDVGAGIDRAADYLIENGVTHITILTRDGGVRTGQVIQQTVPLGNLLY